MINELLHASESLQALMTLLKAAQHLSNYNEIVAAVSEVNAKLMQANAIALSSQEKQSLLSNRITELENQLRELNNWESESQRYQLIQFTFGGYAFCLTPGLENTEPPHYLCAACMNQRKKSILQPYGEAFLRCSLCHEEIQIANLSPVRVDTHFDLRES
ncbi:MAG: hypothetical protein F9K13_13815 [Candidatus Methylomirabilis oxygeniifera]|uniref:Uncharacterized protein n=1 Tax=Methylomirabilis oxygeniifera TaxID=671143 RepID=D5MMW4_METO1|nr:MAG: hypothetical protein F9K13_13815 [Candidatus Methylomirabilis oxyfera]CBE68064.1 conserved protein of unknown function [Candidatus Methylomirabilis oxyfera]